MHNDIVLYKSLFLRYLILTDQCGSKLTKTSRDTIHNYHDKKVIIIIKFLNFCLPLFSAITRSTNSLALATLCIASSDTCHHYQLLATFHLYRYGVNYLHFQLSITN